MASDAIQLYNFYRRYRWTAADFTGWQTGMVEHSRGMFEGLFQGAVLDGFGLNFASMDLEVGAGIASGPTGYLHVINEVSDLGTISPPSGDIERALVVVRPNLVDNTFITRPTNPFDSVPLRTQQGSTVVLLRGEPSTAPEYPATGANDVVLIGLRLYAGQTAISEADLDFEVRDLPGKHTGFQQDAGKYDDRLRPYRVSNSIIGIKPSQLESPFARVFSYVNKALPSIFPKDSGGDYNGGAGDTFLNFTTGAITGADEISSDFAPVIPSSGTSLVATVSMAPNDELQVVFGVEGTRDQCLAGIKSMKSAGAGSVDFAANTKPIAFVLLTSADGANITELDLFDCRGGAGVGETAGGILGSTVRTPTSGEFPITLTQDNNGDMFNIDPDGAARTINLPAPIAGYKVSIKDIVGEFDLTPVTVSRNGGGYNIEGLAADYVLDAPFGAWTFYSDGTNYFLFRS